jgi:hypothetical protein
MSKRLLSAAMVAVAAGFLSLTGCLDYKYEEADVRAVLKGTVPSHASRYRIPAPAIPILRKNIGIIREGGLFAVIVSPDLKGTVEKYSGEGVEYGVYFRREPLRHLLLERVWAGGKQIEVPDADAFKYTLPDLVNASGIPFDQFPQDDAFCELKAPDDAKLQAAVDHPMFVTGFHVREGDLPDALAGTQLVQSVGCPTERMRYFLTSDGSDYLLCDHDPMTALMLDYLITEKREFQGGIRLAGVFDRAQRAETGVSGMADVQWIALGGPMYFRSH